ncbi:MAG: hypothetical protein EZS28_019787 [Streblomastix strix]|uniref:Uncharacterized protein n=1 Tax=Streblomastix strix TaxID=222440 RepID=A0A5J4VQZ8_9EUKA|nr:MAG: hypothetical protein EZS28_019787 [Streblomastix strix]
MQKDQESNSTNNNENNSILLQLMEHENPGQRINISNYGPYNILQLLKTSVGEDQKYILGQINTNCSISPDTCELYVREGLIPLIVDLCLKEDSDLQTKMLCLMTLLAILNEFSSEQQKQQLVATYLYLRLQEMNY